MDSVRSTVHFCGELCGLERWRRMRMLKDVVFYPGWRQVSLNPTGCVLMVVLTYLVCFIVAAPIVLLDMVVGPVLGPLIILLGGVFIARWCARCISFPASTGSFMGSVARQYLKDIMDTLGQACKEGDALCTKLQYSAASPGSLPVDQYESIKQLAENMPTALLHMRSIAGWLKSAPKEELTRDLDEYEGRRLVYLTSAVHAASSALELTLEVFRLAAISPGTPPEQAHMCLVVDVRKALGDLLSAVIEVREMCQMGLLAMWLRMAVWHVTGKVRGILSIALPLMREQLKEKKRTEPITITTDDGPTLHGVIVSYLSLVPRVPEEGRAGPLPDPLSAVGTVMFCAPNAGFFEAMCLAPQGRTWLDFYNALGYDVCMWNYRGFGQSTGAPTPAALQRDGQRVAAFLKERNPGRLIVHGESMGGLVATHVARHMPEAVDMLVCDRTFASLDAVGERLMGRWAALALTLVARWSTDSAVDFEAVSCEKLVLQDPNDAMIHHPCSLKAGLATRRLYGCDDYSERYLPLEYELAVSLGFPLPASTSELGALAFVGLDAAASPTHPFPEAVVCRFFACLRELGRASAESTRQRRDKAEAPPAGATMNPIVALAGRGGVEMGQSATGSTAGGLGAPTDETYPPMPPPVPTSAPIHPGGRRVALNLAPTSPMTILPVEGPVTKCACCAGKHDGWGGSGGVRQWLELFCSQELFDETASPELAPIDRVWVALLRMDGGCGQLLGQIVAKSYDEVRAWLACLVLYTDKCAVDESRPPSASSPAEAVAQLRRLRELYPAALSDSPALDFVMDVLDAVLKRVAAAVDAPVPGTLLSLHCGHSGWPRPSVLDVLQRKIAALPDVGGVGMDV